MNDANPYPANRENASASSPLPKLLDIHGAVWLALARKCCGGDHQLGEDALWEAIHALDRVKKDGCVENVSAWMATTIRNLAAKRLRSETGQKRLRYTLAETAPPQGHQATGPTEADEAFLIKEGHWGAIHAALPHLPPRQREVIRMRLLERLSPKEIAENLRCAESAVHMAQAKAVKNLQHLVLHEVEPSEIDASGA